MGLRGPRAFLRVTGPLADAGAPGTHSVCGPDHGTSHSHVPVSHALPLSPRLPSLPGPHRGPLGGAGGCAQHRPEKFSISQHEGRPAAPRGAVRAVLPVAARACAREARAGAARPTPTRAQEEGGLPALTTSPLGTSKQRVVIKLQSAWKPLSCGKSVWKTRDCLCRAFARSKRAFLPAGSDRLCGARRWGRGFSSDPGQWSPVVASGQ